MTMPENKIVFFLGDLGSYYPFTLYPLDATLPDTGAVYIYTRSCAGRYEPLYIGETDALHSCIQNRPNWKILKRQFVDSICVYLSDDVAYRQRMESILVGIHKPIV